MRQYHSRFPTDSNELPCELMELGKKIQQQPLAVRSELDGLYTQVVDSIHHRRRILSLVQEALAQLRLDIKYLVFDLEATRNERDQLREQLDQSE